MKKQRKNAKSGNGEVETTTAATDPEAAPDKAEDPGVEEIGADVESSDSEAPGEDPRDLELAQTQDRFLRLQADFDNYRKRVLRERAEIRQSATRDVVESILPVLDHVDFALAAAREHKTGEAFIEGMEMLSRQLTEALESVGLEQISGEGEVFDANLHEAVSYLPHAELAEGMVVSQTRSGYRLGDRLLRPAQVIVSSGAPVEASE